MAGASKPRSSQAIGGRASQKRAHPKETKQLKSSSRAAPTTTKVRTIESQSQSPPAPPVPLSPQMKHAAHMRELSEGPIAATFDTPQAFKVLNDRVASRTGLLAHARQAQNLGIDAIELGERVPAPQGDKATMASPVPQQPATVPQIYRMPAGGFTQHDMHRTASMPPMHHGLHTQFGGMEQPNMRMSGLQQTQTGPMHMGTARQLNLSGQNTQFRGNAQHMGPNQVQFMGMGSNMGTNMMGNMGGGIGMNVGQPFGYNNPFGQMQPPPTPQRLYHQSPLNYGPAGPDWGMMPGNAQFNNHHVYPGQIGNPFNNGQYGPSPSPMQRTNPQMPKVDPMIDPQLFNTNPFISTQPIDQQGAAVFNNMGRPPTRNGPIATPRQNGPAISTTQGVQNGVTATPQPNGAPQLTSPEASRGVSATPRPNAAPQWTNQDTTNEATATPRQNHPAISTAQEFQIGKTAVPRPKCAPKSTTPETPRGETAIPRLNDAPKSPAQEPRTNTSAPSQGTTPSSLAVPVIKKVVITLDNPRFHESFTFPASNKGWYVIAKEQFKKENKSEPEDLHSKICNGNFEVRMINPIFRSKVVWELPQHGSGQTINQIEQPSHCLRVDQDALTATMQCEGLGLSQVAKPPTAGKAPVAGPSQAKANMEPKTPLMKSSPCPTNQETPSISPLRLTGPDEESPSSVKKPTLRPSVGTRNSDLVPKELSRLSPQLLESHSKKSHDRQTGKRAVPTIDEELSPSKRHKSSNQNVHVTGGASVLSSGMGTDSINGIKKSTLALKSFPGSPLQSIEPYSEKDRYVVAGVHHAFLKGVAELPAPNPSQLPPPAGNKYLRKPQAQNYVPPHPFNPRPSQPLNNFAPYHAQAPNQYSGAVSGLMTELADSRLPEKWRNHPFVNPPYGPGVPVGMLPFPQVPMPNGFLCQQPRQLQLQSMGGENIANNQKQQPQNQGYDFSANTASNQQQVQENQSFKLGTNDNSDLDEILSGNMNRAAAASPPRPSYSDAHFNSNSDPTCSHLQNIEPGFSAVGGTGSLDFDLNDADFDKFFDEPAQTADEASPPVPSGDSDPSSNSNSNHSASEPKTPEKAEPQSSHPFIDSNDFPSENGGFDSFLDGGLVQDPGPFRAANDASPLTQSLYEHQSHGGEFRDILDHEGLYDPAKQRTGENDLTS